jgi:hypothetical protein
MATMLNWFLAFLVTKFFANVLDALGNAWCYWMFAIICAVGTVFVFIFVPETKGKSIEEIQRHFGAPTPTPTIAPPLDKRAETNGDAGDHHN